MKKRSFMENTAISTFSIFLIKILGMIYVIPFYAIVGIQGAALYAYAYNIYGFFLEVATAGIPNAVGKLINEFNTLDKQEAKIRTFQIGKKLLTVIAVIAFLIMFLFASQIASLILGDLSGGNSIADVAFAIRCVSFALLIFPFLSVIRGFFLGHQHVSVLSFSQLIEQIVRVVFIILGSFIALKWLHIDLTKVVGVAVFSAFIGGACSLIYVYNKLKKNRQEFNLETNFETKDNITNKEIIKKILKYAIPSVIISLAFSIYNNIDMILILRTMNSLGFSAIETEFISTAISTWAAKISIIITSVGLGLAPSLIAEMVKAHTLKKHDEVNEKFNKALEITLFLTIPMCVGISLLSKPIWTVFYGFSELGASILAMCIFSPLFSNLYTISNYTLQSLNKYRLVYISAITGILINAILDVPFMLIFNYLGLPAYNGATLATIVGFSTTLLIAMWILKKEFNFKYKEIIVTLKNMIVPLVLMVGVVTLLKALVPVNYTDRLSCIFFIGVVATIGSLVYFIMANKLGLLNQVLGNDFLTKITNKFKKNKKV